MNKRRKLLALPWGRALRENGRHVYQGVLALTMSACLLTGCQTAAGPVRKAEQSAVQTPALAAGGTDDSVQTPESGRTVAQSLAEGRRSTAATEYYDNIFISKPEVATSRYARQNTRQNIAAYNFDEQAYRNTVMTGGTSVRQIDFIRGVGGNQLTSSGTYGTMTAWEIATDERYFEELNITSKRSWDTGYGEDALAGRAYSAACGSGFSTQIDWSAYADGTQAGTPRFGAANAKAKAIEGIKKYQLDRLTTAKNLLCCLLGNEFLYISINPSTGRYARTGYDSESLTQFRSWLRERFGTVENLNAKCGTKYLSLADASPDGSTALQFEHFLFSRRSFYEAGKAAVEYSRSQNPNIAYGYASYCSYNCAYGNDAYLDFLDYNTSNLYKEAWWDNTPSPFATFSYQLDNLGAVSDKPIVLTETGFTNGFTEASQKKAARSYSQTLPLVYMRPQGGGTYAYTYMSSLYDTSNLYSTWDIVRCEDRSKTKSFDAIAKCYSDFKMLDSFYRGSSNTPLVALTNKFVDRQIYGSNGGGGDATTSVISQVLYTNGIPVRALLNDSADDVKNLDTDKIILTDDLLAQKPDGSDDVATALAQYMNDGGRVLRLASSVPEPYYGVGTALSAASNEALAEKFSGRYLYQPQSTASSAAYDKLWQTLAPFVHQEFVEGKIRTQKNAVNESAVRILEVSAENENGFAASNPTWKLQTQLVYKNGHLYLGIVNTGDETVNGVTVTLGVNNGVKLNLHPQVLCAGSDVKTAAPERIAYPSWVDETVQSKIGYAAFTIDNLSTYAFIDVGMAIVA